MRDRKPTWTAIALGGALAALLAVAGPALAGGVECKADADCVPAACCHATSCVPVAEAPDCKAVACTAECRPGTLDCGGKCVCTADGQCTAQLKEEPAP